jgi:HSP20 family protein
MKIVKRDYPFNPLHEIENFFNDDMFGFFPSLKRHFEPPMDIYQTEKEFVVELQTPKTLAEKVNVSVEDGILKIEASQSEEKQEEGRQYFRREIRQGGFMKMISLPVPVKDDEAKAVYENGVLKVTVPKSEIKEPKKINVEVK